MNDLLSVPSIPYIFKKIGLFMIVLTILSLIVMIMGETATLTISNFKSSRIYYYENIKLLAIIGLVFIAFSKEKIDDERDVQFKMLLAMHSILAMSVYGLIGVFSKSIGMETLYNDVGLIIITGLSYLVIRFYSFKKHF